MTTATPFMSSLQEVLPEWIDYNGHLNMAYYNVLFDRGADEAFAQMGFGPEYAAERKMTTYSAEFHVRYLRELHEGDKVRVAFQLLDADDKRFHFCQWLYHEDGWLSATGEGLGLHIDMSGPRVAPYPQDVADKVAALKEAHAGLPIPDFVGKPIGIRRKSG
ncbi:thioesterase family protein [Thalassovita aquimarina]|uniref:Thioesterase family protein n=1 Tax=Thalassovita aquimarina TaxID=2785917 RepID=A0ABS5HQG0_9RHOB|nr:thioesterase family protein [Thalassovita aquimarina]MBR9651219.1 thioesterase family protein [Thalassovita aquimarina]